MDAGSARNVCSWFEAVTNRTDFFCFASGINRDIQFPYPQLHCVDKLHTADYRYFFISCNNIFQDEFFGMRIVVKITQFPGFKLNGYGASSEKNCIEMQI